MTYCVNLFQHIFYYILSYDTDINLIRYNRAKLTNYCIVLSYCVAFFQPSNNGEIS